PFLVGATRVRREQDTSRAQRRVQFAEDPRQLRTRHVEERCIREDAVEACLRQVEGDEVLLPYLAARCGPGQVDERRRPGVTERAERAQIAAGTAAEVEDVEWRRPHHVSQQGRDVLLDVVIPGAVTERGRAALVARDRAPGR